MKKIEVVEYFDGNEINFGKKVDESDNKFTIEKISKQKLKLSSNRILFVHTVNNSDNLATAIAELETSIKEQRADIDVAELWEIVQEEIRDYTMEELTSFLVDEPSSIMQSALFHSIREEKNRFKRKGLILTPRTAEQIEEIEIQQQREEDKLKVYNFFYDNVGAAMRQDNSVDSDIFSHLMKWLKESDNSVLTEVIEKYANSQESRVFVYNILKSNEQLPENADKFATLFGIEQEFSQEVITEAEQLTLDLNGREDLTHLTTYTIDSAETKEIDDAISFDLVDGNYLVGIHISDLGSFIHDDTSLDEEAYRRVSTIYLETGEIPMFPRNLCHEKLSLIKGETRPTLSALFTFTPEFELISEELKLANIIVKHKISYPEVDKLLKENRENSAHEFVILKNLTTALREKRFENGAIEINRPELNITVVDDKVTLKVNNLRAASRRIVSELMIFMNEFVAEFTASYQIPYIYRIQEMPDENYKHYLQPDYYDPIINDKLLRLIRPSSLVTHPGKHYGLGVDCYSQITSPLRRYFDLVMQKQVVYYLKNSSSLYSQEDILSFIAHIESVNKTYGQLYSASSTYWFMIYLEQNLLYEPLPAVVVSDNEKSYTCELLQYGKRYNIKSREPLYVGDRVNLLIDKIEPEREFIKFTLMND